MKSINNKIVFVFYKDDVYITTSINGEKGVYTNKGPCQNWCAYTLDSILKEFQDVNNWPSIWIFDYNNWVQAIDKMDFTFEFYRNKEDWFSLIPAHVQDEIKKVEANI